MKKKIKDLTIGELYEYCTKNGFYSCWECPIISLCEKSDASCLLASSILFTHKELEKKVEIPNEPVGNTDQVEEEE